MSIRSNFTTTLCIHQALVCYINSFIFTNLCLFGSCTKILALSHTGEVVNNIFRAITIVWFKYLTNKFMFILNVIASFILTITTIIFFYATYQNYNFLLCTIVWTANRICNSVIASCRDVMLYRLNSVYNLNINIPIIKTIKAAGNIINLIKILLITSSIYQMPLIYIHLFICIFMSFINIAVCYYLYLISFNIDTYQLDDNKIKSDVNFFNREVILQSLKLLMVTILLNLAQVDDAIIFFKIQNRHIAFILKQCVGQIGLGMLYAFFFKNSKYILAISPLINFLFHYCSIQNYNFIGAIVMGLQFTIKNSLYVLLAMILCPYNQIYPAICILSDAVGIFISNGIFIYLSYIFNEAYAHKIFFLLSIASLIFGLCILLINDKNKDKINKNKE